MKIRTIVVDDEPLGRERIRSLLERDEEIEIIADCADGKQAVEAIAKSNPDLVYLDIQMPEMDGFQVLEAIAGPRMPVVIFVTAHDQYAIKAFEVHALDYLLKSFDRERFSAALERAKIQIRQSKENLNERLVGLLEDLEKRQKHATRLVIRSAGRVSFLRVEEIDWIEAADNYVRIHAGRESYLMRETLQSLETRLDPAKILRINRSTMVNVERIKEMLTMFHGDYLVRLHDGTELTLSRNYRDKVAVPLGEVL